MGQRTSSILFFFLALLFVLSPVLITAFTSIDSIVNTGAKQVGFVLFGLSFFALLLSLFRPRYFLLVLIPVALVVPIELYVVFTLKTALSDGVMASLFNTNVNEIQGLLTANILYVFASLVFVGVFIFLALKVSKEMVLGRRTRFGLLIFFISVQTLIIGRDIYVTIHLKQFDAIVSPVISSYRIKASKTFPANWFQNAWSYVANNQKLKSYNARVGDFVFGARETEPVTGKKVMVMVIGETARRANFSLYGYHRNTNPLLAQEDRLIAMRNAETVYNLTSLSYPVFMTRATPNDFERHLNEPSLMKAFKEAGFHTVYINNQLFGHGSIYHSYASQSDTLIDLASSFDTYSNDGVILPVFEEIFDNLTHDKTLIVIHSLGSHFRYNYRYPQAYEVYKPNITSDLDLSAISRKQRTELVNSYDNTILYTDYFLTALISTLKKESGYASLMLYASDHGENLYDDERFGFAHGGSVMSAYEKEIPLLIWRSEGYDLVYGHKIQTVMGNLDAPVKSTHFFHTMLDLSGIYIDDQTLINSFASPQFSPQPEVFGDR